MTSADFHEAHRTIALLGLTARTPGLVGIYQALAELVAEASRWQ